MMVDIENKYFGFIYETTNTIDSKKYIGKCIFGRINNWKTYLGSGVYLKRAIKKYRKENFKREILFLALDNEELNELEELVIDLSNAVSSNKYYNLKKTAIGGDIFTDHPEKERIRKMRREQMSGKGNHQYGKTKTKKMINSVKEANSKKVIVNQIVYDSVTAYSNEFNISITTVCYRLNSPYYEDYLYLDEAMNPISKETKRIEDKKHSRARKRFVVNGVEFNTIREGIKLLKIGTKTLRDRLNSDDYPEYYYL
ncbi:hypothetical protein [Lysinibacillus sp. BW-2-10]|uniref:hypothetical protein n=1 Tax=Lysinibacillus sp. BW-2-10 TaxID=2590030 RepID=UPI00117FBE58|nr:hypothetical protein [Lysinibacillus sp. BW-2-10]TSI08669.1 hypothetical protein FJQ64_06875 [Lysinibacillus sp. BW-2-10]